MSPERHDLEAVLLDLDGTLADTAPDIAAALNRLRRIHNRSPLNFATIRPVVSRGGAALIALAFPEVESSVERDGLRREFLDLYAESLQNNGQLFPGMDTVLEFIEAQNWPWGIVTNKPTWLTRPLIAVLGLEARLGCLVCGDMVARPKPDPQALLLACNQLGVAPRLAVYIGDARRDIEAGQAAGLTTLAAAFGYLAADDDPAAWGADAVIDSPAAIRDWLRSHALPDGRKRRL